MELSHGSTGHGQAVNANGPVATIHIKGRAHRIQCYVDVFVNFYKK